MASPSSLSVDLSQAFVMAPPGLGEWLVILPPALMITAGALLMMMRHRVDRHGFIAIPALVALVLIDAALLWKVSTGGPVTMMMGRWLPPFGIAFTVDVLGR